MRVTTAGGGRRKREICASLLLLTLSSAVAPSAGAASQPPEEPLPRVAIGMHTAPIARIATDAAGRWAVTASHDKTARVWELKSGRLLTVLRPPQGDGWEGMLYAVAMSPDGAAVAVAGATGLDWDGALNIYVFDRASGRLTLRLPGLPAAVRDLAFSPEGRWLAASLAGANGTRVYDAATGVEVGRDADYEDSSYSVDFSSDGRFLLTTSNDGRLRLYSVEEGALRLLRSQRPGGGERPYTARFSPTGERIAVGFDDTSTVQVLDARLVEVARPQTTGVDNGNLLVVAWSADGRHLLAGGRWEVAGRHPVRRWSVDDGWSYTDQTVTRNTLLDLVPLPVSAGGGWLFAAFDPAWGRISFPPDREVADFRAQWDLFGVSSDGRRVRFGYREFGPEPRVFDLTRRRLGPDHVEGLPPARVEAPGLSIVNWRNSLHPALNGRALPLENVEESRSLAIAPDHRKFLLGSDWYLRLFDSGGRELWRKRAPGVAWAVNVSGDGRFAVAAHGDGTIRWHRIEDGREVLALFPHADRKRWVAWTPEGFFDAAPGAEELIGYHLNHGPDRAGEFVSSRQLWETFYRPELVGRRLDADGERLIGAAVAEHGDVRELLRAGSIPRLELLSPAAATSDGAYRLKVRTADLGRGKGRLVVRIDGTELEGRWTAPALTPGGEVEIPVDLAEGLRTLTVELVDGRGVSSPPVTARIEVRRPAARLPALHLLAVGVSGYRDRALSTGVRFAAEDARSVAAALERGALGLYRPGEKRVLRDEKATRQAILAAGRELAAAAGPEDAVVVYLAGHGLSIDGDYHFVPWEARYSNQRALKEQSLDARRLRELLAGFTSRKLLVLLDTCSSGSFSLGPSRGLDDKASIDRLQRLTGRALIAAAADEKMALEGEGGHGVFTFALLDALAGAADRDQDRHVDVSEIARHVDELVPEITKRNWGYEQFAMMETTGSSFPVVRRAP